MSKTELNDIFSQISEVSGKDRKLAIKKLASPPYSWKNVDIAKLFEIDPAIVTRTLKDN